MARRARADLSHQPLDLPPSGAAFLRLLVAGGRTSTAAPAASLFPPEQTHTHISRPPAAAAPNVSIGIVKSYLKAAVPLRTQHPPASEKAR